MGYTVVVKFPGDLATFRKAVVERAEEIKAITEKGKSLGAIHHRFAFGDGYLIVVDEWESPEGSQALASDPEFHAFAASAGASGAPEIWVGESINSADEF